MHGFNNNFFVPTTDVTNTVPTLNKSLAKKSYSLTDVGSYVYAEMLNSSWVWLTGIQLAHIKPNLGYVRL